MNIDELSRLTLHDLQIGFASRRVSPVEVMSMTLTQVSSTQGLTHAIYDLRPEAAMDEAHASESRYAKGKAISEFDGIPVTLKDSVNAVGMNWHHGSAMHGNGVVSQSDSPPTTRLKNAGAIVFGKCVMPDTYT